jgi:putative hydrolase of the HAD superfamily
MEKQNILFDLDDTLIHCNKYFYLTIDQFVLKMSDWFNDYPIPIEEFKRKQTEIDLLGVHKHGFLKERFPLSLVETYEHFVKETGRSKNQKEIEGLFELGSSVYDHEYEAYPDMDQTLTLLKEEGHELSLFTGGDTLVQNLKVETLGLDRFFDNRIYISQHKTTKVLDHIIVENKMKRDRTWMIGNSARTDVIPALEAGIHSIFIPTQNEWEFNTVPIDIVPKGEFLTLSSLNEVPPAIQNYSRKAI